MKVPGLSVTLGMSQGTQKPYARVTGRHGGFVLGKNLDLLGSKGLIAIAAGILLANAVKQSKVEKTKKVRNLKDVTPVTTVESGSSSQMRLIKDLFGGIL